MTLRVLLACHAGQGVGLGHLMRSLVVARALRRRLGADVQLIIQSEPLQREDLAAFPHQFVAPDANLGQALDAQRQAMAAAVIALDLHPQRPPADLATRLQQWRQLGCRLIAIDGLLAHRPSLDLIFLPSFRFVPPPDLPAGAPIRFGWDCLLLEPLPEGHRRPEGREVLALTGGSDATGLGRDWPRLLDQQLPEDARLHWVTGPFSARPVLPASPRIAAFEEHVAPAGLGPLMRQASFAVTVFGVSFFELLQYGVPTVVFSPYGSKDQPELDALRAEGLAWIARDHLDATQQLARLMADTPAAAALSQRAQARLGRPGGDHLADAVAQLTRSTCPRAS